MVITWGSYVAILCKVMGKYLVLVLYDHTGKIWRLLFGYKREYFHINNGLVKKYMI